MGKAQVLETGLSLLRWQLPKGKINPKTLGYVCPNGSINFQTAETAQTYAKNRVMSALHAPKPFERAVFVEENKISGDIDGTVHKVHFDHKILDGHKDVTLVHGHPTNTPLSTEDYLCLEGNNGLKSIISTLGTEDFARLRIGTGNDELRRKMGDVDFVLSKYTPEEKTQLPAVLSEVADRIDEFLK